MTVDAPTRDAPALAAPVPRGGGSSLLGFLTRGRDNWLESFGADAYEEPFAEQRLLWRHHLVVNDPAVIKRVLLDNADNYTKTAIARRLLEPGLGKGLITLEGDAWRRHRRMLAPAFDHQSILSYAPIMAGVADDMMARWAGLAPDAVIDMAQEMGRATLRIVARAMFSLDSREIEASVATAVRHYQATLRPGLLDLLNLPDWVSQFRRTWVARREFGGLDARLTQLVADRRGRPAPERPDLLTRLLAARDEATGERLSEQEIHDHVITILMAGHETTAVALGWVWYLLAMHPREAAMLHGELAAVLGGRAPSFEDLTRLPYTRMVIEEAMRLYPPAHTMSRQAREADELGGRKIAKGAVVLIVPWVLHRHRKLWERPERFEPERFTPERAERRSKFAYIPFGAGPRVCIGAAFAMTEAMMILASVAQRFRPRLVPGHPVVPHGLITLRARHGLKMTLERRC